MGLENAVLVVVVVAVVVVVVVFVVDIIQDQIVCPHSTICVLFRLSQADPFSPSHLLLPSSDNDNSEEVEIIDLLCIIIMTPLRLFPYILWPGLHTLSLPGPPLSLLVLCQMSSWLHAETIMRLLFIASQICRDYNEKRQIDVR